MTNGRCKNHGGMSTGPRPLKVAKPFPKQPAAMAWGGRIRVLEGFYRWLEGGGREMLSRLAKNREDIIVFEETDKLVMMKIVTAAIIERSGRYASKHGGALSQLP
jgi:hypothetical protein